MGYNEVRRNVLDVLENIPFNLISVSEPEGSIIYK